MKLRLTGAVVLASSLAACSGSGGGTPTALQAPAAQAPAAGSKVLATSGVRAPEALLADGQRKREALGASAYPLSAVAWPLSAVAWPLSAVAWAGMPPVPTSLACSDEDAGPHKPTNCRATINAVAPFNPDPNAAPSAIAGIQPGLLRWIYNLPDHADVNAQTVAIVVAYDNPRAEADLAIYRSTFGLPPCTTLNGCFRKIAGTGSSLPQTNTGWSVESSLDLDAISATCPDCKLLLVEAASNQIPDLAVAVDTAVTAGATVVNNSYGVVEAADNVEYASHYVHPGVAITAAAGDIGFGVQFPASVPTVTAVGGTSVQQIGNGAVQEVAWSRTGGGCSAFFPKPAWQVDKGCANRTVNDVAMLADPADGVAVYDSTLPNTPHGGWSVIGGTSLAAPLIAAVFALGAKDEGVGTNTGIYAAGKHKSSTVTKRPWLLNITGGSNGTCAIAYLCNGGIGYNAPTGNGVAWGVKAFAGKD
ncbi:MAG: hypothetical protein NVSMB19_18790 [Vulcanimicrobiaceae bacterium]